MCYLYYILYNYILLNYIKFIIESLFIVFNIKNILNLIKNIYYYK